MQGNDTVEAVVVVVVDAASEVVTVTGIRAGVASMALPPSLAILSTNELSRMVRLVPAKLMAPPHRAALFVNTLPPPMTIFVFRPA